MNRTSLFLSAAAVLMAGIAGCQAIAGLSSRTLDPLPTVGCALPSTGDGRVRIANLANVSANADFCIRTSGSGDWGRPIFRDGGNDALCLGTQSQAGGLAYGQVTVPFAVPVGKIDVKTIPAGQTCSATATSEKDGITIANAVTGGAPPTTLVRWGGGTSAEGLSALSEYAKTTGPVSSNVRIVNALSDGKAIEIGQAAGTTLPTTVPTVNIATPITPGNAAAPQNGLPLPQFNVNANGYMSFPDQSFVIAAFYSTDSAANALAALATPSTALGTFYVIGDPTDTSNKHVVRALYCDESVGGYSTTSCGADAGGVPGLPAYIPCLDDALFAQCTETSLPVISVDLVNAALYGANAPFSQARGAVIPGAIAARTSDIMCILEVDDSSSRNAIIAAALSQFPYSYQITTDLTTNPTNPSDVKPPPAAPPCTGSNAAPWITCVTQNCGVASDAGPVLDYTACLENSCFSSLVKIPYTQPLPSPYTAAEYAGDSCFDCTIYNFLSEPLSEGETCVTAAQQPFAFNGQSPELILSHYPLVNTKSYILPATGFRRAVLKAQVQLADQTVDFFCAQLSSPLIDSTLPYTGNYGNDNGPHGNGWEDEQDLQAEEIVAWIKSEEAVDGLPAIIAGDFHAGLGVAPTVGDAGTGSSAEAGANIEISPEAIQAFISPDAGITLVPAIPSTPTNYVEACDYCPAPENPYNPGEGPYEILHAFLYDFPSGATQSETLWGTDNAQVALTSLPGEDAPDSGTGPLFEYYAHNYQLLRPTPAANQPVVTDGGH